MRADARVGGSIAGVAVTVLGTLLTAPAALGAQDVIDLPAEDRAVRVSLEEVYSVGGAREEAEWEIFGELRGAGSLAFDGAGNLHVFDRDNARVVVVDPSGRLVREFGKRGEGPGEWRMPITMTVLRDGSVVITDLGHRAHLVYGPDGELARTVSIEAEGGGISIGSLLPDPRGGHMYSSAGGGMQIRMRTGGGPADASPRGNAPPGEAPRGSAPPGRAIERMSLEDGSRTPFHTAWAPPPNESPTTLRGGGTTFRMGAGGPRAFEPSLHVGVLPDGGLAVVDSTTWTVEVVGPDGSLQRVLRRPSLRPREVTPGIEEQEKERRLAELEAGEGPQMRVMVQSGGAQASPVAEDQIREMQRAQLEETAFYPEIPVVDRLAAGWEGTLWIERTPARWWEPGPIDLVTTEGRYIGTVAPSEAGIPAAFGPDGLVAYLERDELDVPTISVARLPAPLR